MTGPNTLQPMMEAESTQHQDVAAAVMHFAGEGSAPRASEASQTEQRQRRHTNPFTQGMPDSWFPQSVLDAAKERSATEQVG